MNIMPEILRQHGANACVECGKCSAACSMAAMYPDFSGAYSPRGLVQHALRQAAGLDDAVDPAGLWRCLQCGNCSTSCPEGVDPAGLIAALRGEERATGQDAQARFCACCGRDLPAQPVQEWLRGVLPDGKWQDDLDPEAT